MPSLQTQEPVLATPEEQSIFLMLDSLMLRAEEGHGPKLVGPDGEAIELPESLFNLLRQVVHNMAQGKAVTLVPSSRMLTTQQAADILNVSRPFLVKLLEAGELPFVKVGSHRRIRLDELITYKRLRDSQRRQGLARLTQLGEEMGDYD